MINEVLCVLWTVSKSDTGCTQSASYSTVTEILVLEIWSPGPKFSLENMVRLLKNRSGLKTLILGLLLKQENIKRQQINEGQASNSQRT